MIITKDKSYTNYAFFDEFVKLYKKETLDCEVNFENIYNAKKETYDIIRVWFPSDLYGHSFLIKNGQILVNHIDGLRNEVIDIKTNDNICKLIMGVIVDERHKK